MDQMHTEHFAGNPRIVYGGVEEHLQEPVWQAAMPLLARPGYERAVLAYCRRMVEPNDFRWPANKIFAQKTRYITCYMLIALAGRFDLGIGPAPTMTLLKSVGPGSGRQASDLIAGLRAGGYVTAEQNPSDRRELILRPTEALILKIARSPLAFLASSALLEQHALHDWMAVDPLRMGDLLARSMDAILTKDVLFAPFPTIVDFSGRDSGYLILCAVIGAHLSRSGGESWDLPLSYDALSQRFQVSRQHVGNVLTPSVKRGLFSIQNGRIEDVDGGLLTEFFWWSAGQMVHYQMVARESSSG
ncbi:MAG: MarR family transcriptional regulator [Alphaproteobacteria bacterium]|nr:MarR family transcriptional regulator [Alphaproteobacteria bacterium]